MRELGVSTASFFGDYVTEDSMRLIAEMGIPVAEVFLTTFYEYKPDFVELVASRRGQTRIHSVHAMTTQFEPQLFNQAQRTREDSEVLFDSVTAAAQRLGAKYYTFHGPARLKKTFFRINYESIGTRMAELCARAASNDVRIAFENVHWAYYNYVGFFEGISKYAPDLCATLDIKQAVQAKLDYKDLLDEMGDKLVTIHVTDCFENGEVTMPPYGDFDFYRFFCELNERGITAPVLMEVYTKSYNGIDEFKRSYEYLYNTLVRAEQHAK